MFPKNFMAAACAFFMSLGSPVYADETGLSELEIGDLVFMREEEKLARDVYEELYQYYKIRGTELIVLANIAVSEQRHMDAMMDLLDKYQLSDPAAGLEHGEFDNDVLSLLYDNLVSDSNANRTILNEPLSGGKVSPEAALYVGAWIEERDMIDILHAIENTTRADIVGVYTSLLCGSRAHLRAFVKHLGADDYQPQLLHTSVADGSDISPVETLAYWLGEDSDQICM